MKNIICNIVGHQYKVTKNITTHIKEFECLKCKKQMTIGENGLLRPLTPKFKEINHVLRDIHLKKERKHKKHKISA